MEDKKGLVAFLPAIIKHIDKKELAKANWAVIKPALEAAAADTDESAIDDVIVKAISILVEKFVV